MSSHAELNVTGHLLWRERRERNMP